MSDLDQEVYARALDAVRAQGQAYEQCVQLIHAHRRRRTGDRPLPLERLGETIDRLMTEARRAATTRETALAPLAGRRFAGPRSRALHRELHLVAGRGVLLQTAIGTLTEHLRGERGSIRDTLTGSPTPAGRGGEPVPYRAPSTSGRPVVDLTR